MRRLIFISIVLLFMFAPSICKAQITVLEATTPNYTLLNGVTTTGAGTAVNMSMFTSKCTCHVTWGGTAPTNTVVALEGSIDNSTYAALATVTVTATGTMWHVADKPVRYIRGNYVSKSGGDATTAVTLICTSGGN